MRLISINAWGGNLSEALADYVRDTHPDILLLQEVTWAVDPSPDRVFFREHGFDLRQKTDLFADLGKLLPEHQGYFCPSSQGEVIDDDDRAYQSRFGIASFVHRDLAVIGQVQDFIHGAYSGGGWGTPPVPRSMHALRLAGPDKGRPFLVAHTHGLRIPSGKHDTPERMAQAERIRAVLETLRQAGRSGDLWWRSQSSARQPDIRPFGRSGPDRSGHDARFYRHAHAALRKAATLCRLPPRFARGECEPVSTCLRNLWCPTIGRWCSISTFRLCHVLTATSQMH